MASSKSLLRDALAATTTKDKGPPVVDGILSITPDTPEVVEWRRSALDITETSSVYLDDEDEVGPRPNELFGKFTWKIENFSEISKRELRSNVFDVGTYKWYILVYPQGCDVCNHLSLFLCVADYDKLLPGWSHFAQFTIAVVNKDPKKSKYSDTLHRFCKKEHDWGWKKFMELSKVLDGFTVADTLVIKAQVQVILDKPSRPFRCLDPQYRRELVRVYLTNVEGVCRRFCDDKRARLMWVQDEADSFKDYWLGLSAEKQRKLLFDRGDSILKSLVKQFFNEKEVTSTLVMDALYSGCRQIEEHSRLWVAGKCPDDPPIVLIHMERNAFSLHTDLLDLSDRVSKDFIPMAKDDKMVQPNDGLALRSSQEDDYRRDSIERDEKRLAELGRKTVEMFVISHIITEKMEAGYRDTEALKRQEKLIAEEFETLKQEEEKNKAQAEKDRERKAKKKERQKAKKEEEKAKRDAEEAERRAVLEAEQRVVEAAAAEKRRQEEEAARAAAAAQAQAKAKAQTQAQARAQAAAAQKSAAAAKQSAAQQQPSQQAKPSAQQEQPHTHRRQEQQQKQAPPDSALAAAQMQQQQQPPTQQQQQQQQPATSSHARDQAQPAAAKASSAAAAAAAAAATAAAAAAMSVVHTSASDADGAVVSSSMGASSVTSDATSDSAGSKDVGTLDQAMRLAEEDDSEGSTGSDGRRAELAEELTALRARVRLLEGELRMRDAELHAVRMQLAERGPLAVSKATSQAAATAAAAQHMPAGAYGAYGRGGGDADSVAAGAAPGASQLDDRGTAGLLPAGNGAGVLGAMATRPMPLGGLAAQAAAAAAAASVPRRALTPFEAGRSVANGPHAQMQPPQMLHSQFSAPAIHKAGGGGEPSAAAAAGTNDAAPAAAGAAPFRAAAAGGGARRSGPAGAQPTTPGKVVALPLKDDGPPGVSRNAGGAAALPQHVPSHLNHAAAEFTGGSHLLMHQQVPQQASQPGMPFGHMPAKRPQIPTQMETSGLDDFAHMGLIDDLLTE